MTQKQGVLIGVGVCAALVLLCGGAVGLAALLYTRKPARIDVAQIPHTKLTKAENKATSSRPTPTMSVKVPDVTAPPAKPEKDKVPSNDDLRKLTTASLLDMDQAIKAKDATQLQGKLAGVWQSDANGLANLNKFVQGFNNADLSGVKDVAPVFNPAPMIDAQGRLIVHGYYPAMPQKVSFKFDYSFERGEWRLLNFKVGTGSDI